MSRHLAQLNIATLKAPPGDLRVAEFMEAIDRINAIGKRSRGFVWMMEGSGGPNSGNTGTAVGSDPRLISNLTVWKDVGSLKRFVRGTVHRRFLERRGEWFEEGGVRGFVMWWIPEGERPTLTSALARLDHLREHGDTDHAFGWSHLEQPRPAADFAGAAAP